MSMDIFGMMAELAKDGVLAQLRACPGPSDVVWSAQIKYPFDARDRTVWAATPEEAWRKACDAWDREPEKERYRQKPAPKTQAFIEGMLASAEMGIGRPVRPLDEMPEPGTIHYLPNGGAIRPMEFPVYPCPQCGAAEHISHPPQPFSGASGAERLKLPDVGGKTYRGAPVETQEPRIEEPIAIPPRAMYSMADHLREHGRHDDSNCAECKAIIDSLPPT